MKNSSIPKGTCNWYGVVFLAVLLCISSVALAAQSATRVGTIKGKTLESYTRLGLAGVTVSIRGTHFATITNESGEYSFKDIPVGSYILEFITDKFSPLVKTDIIVKSQSTTIVDAELSMLFSETVEVVHTYFARKQEQATSLTGFSTEEIRRSAGSAGDISRLVGILPSVSRVNDMWNGLVVRGGSPSENAFYIDNIEVPDINHFPMRGSTGGPISILNVDFIKDVHFFTGGFSALYGDRLSSVMDIQLRQGNKEDLNLQLEMSMAGFGLVGEGQLGKKGSWMFSARKSYLDLIVDAIGTGVAPRYSDLQGKIRLDLSPHLQLTTIAVVGIDAINFKKEDVWDLGMDAFGNYNTNIVTVGMTLRALWKENGFSDFSLSQTQRKYQAHFFDILTDEERYRDATGERGIKFRNVNYLRLTDPVQIQFGGEARFIQNQYDYYVGPYTNVMGTPMPAVTKDLDTHALQAGVFVNATWMPFSRFNLNLGFRADYYSYNKHMVVSPRLSLSQNLTDRLSVAAAFGVFHQNLPLELAITLPNGRELKNPLAYHYVLGLNQTLGESSLLTLEVYDKEYYHFPQDVQQPAMFLVDDFYVVGFQTHDRVVDTGRARSYGVELTLQKKMVQQFYGILCIAYFRTTYRGMDGVWRPRVYDNRFIFSMEGGYKPNKRWEFSLRWTYAGGIPYTPFDLTASTAYNTAIFDASQVNGVRNPAYHSLNLRLDKRWYFKKANLTVFVNIWNAYNQKNVAQRFWNKTEIRPDLNYQWSFIPLAGFEFEF